MANTGNKSPGADSGSWSSGGWAYTSDDSRASSGSVSQTHTWSSFAFGIPSSNVIDGIIVTVEGFFDGAVLTNGDYGTLRVDISVDGGTNWSSTKDTNLDIAWDATRTLGGSTDKWGLTGKTGADFSDANFRVRLKFQAVGGGITDVYIDHVQVDVYHSAGAITGTLSKTLATVTKSMAGQVAISGSFNKSLASVTKSMAGAVAIAGTSSKTLSAVTAVSAGQVALSGSLAKTLASLGKSMSGTVSVSGILDEALEALASSGAGTVAVSGGTTYTLGGLTLSSAGSVIVVANLVSTLETISGSKLGAVEVQAIVNKTLESLSLVGAGEVQIVAVTDATLGTIILVSAGGETGSITGSLQQVLGGLVGTLNGAVSIMGDLDVTLGGTVTVVRPGVILLEDGRMAVRAGSVYIIL